MGWRHNAITSTCRLPPRSGRRQAGETGRGTMAYSRTFTYSRVFLALTTLAVLAVLPGSKPADAVPNYDGLWSVVIVTEQGLCDRAYRAPIRISKGTMSNTGGGAYSITGKVGKNGAVTV